jgi:hypothetical protein
VFGKKHPASKNPSHKELLAHPEINEGYKIVRSRDLPRLRAEGYKVVDDNVIGAAHETQTLYLVYKEPKRRHGRSTTSPTSQRSSVTAASPASSTRTSPRRTPTEPRRPAGPASSSPR